MGYITDFENNKRYGADDINGIRTNFMNYGVINKGADDCMVSLEGESIIINSGEALFDDGCRIELTDSETLPYDGADCYVYLDRAYSSAPVPATGNTLPDGCVPLAKITGGQVTDRRIFAALKIPTMAPNRYDTKVFTLDFRDPSITEITKEFSFEDRCEFRYLLFENNVNNHYTKLLYDFETGIVTGINDDYRIWVKSGKTVNLYRTRTTLNITKKGRVIHFTAQCLDIYNLGECSITAI